MESCRENLPEGMQREFFVESSHVSVQLLSFRKNNKNDTIIIMTTIDHIISACPILAEERDRMCAQLHLNICKETGVQLDKKHWYEHVPKSVERSQGCKVNILWNQQVQTDRTIPNNKPDIRIRDNEKGTCVLMDVAISGDRNVIKKKSRTF